MPSANKRQIQNRLKKAPLPAVATIGNTEFKIPKKTNARNKQTIVIIIFVSPNYMIYHYYIWYCQNWQEQICVY